MTSRKSKLIIFDLDGTLVDSSEDITWVANSTRQKLGLDPKGKTEVLEAVGDGLKTFVSKIFYEQSHPQFKNAVDVFKKEYLEMPTVGSIAYEGIPDLLKELHESQQFELAVASNKPNVLLQRLIDEIGWRHYFPLCLGGDSLAKAKPDPMPLLHIAKHYQMNVRQDNCFMVGDSYQDIQAASRAGFTSFWVKWGFNDLVPEGTTHSVAHPSEISRKLLKQI